MIWSEREVTVAAASSKIGRSSLSLIAPVTGVERLVTVSGTPSHRENLEGRVIEEVAVPGRSGG